MIFRAHLKYLVALQANSLFVKALDFNFPVLTRERVVQSPDDLGVHFFQLAAERRRTTAAWGPLACTGTADHSSQLRLLEDAINMRQRFLTFFFLARSKWIYYPSAARHRANGSRSRGWLGFHACVGVWLYFRTHFHWCWHTRRSSETCQSNHSVLCRKIRLLMLRQMGWWQFRMAP